MKNIFSFFSRASLTGSIEILLRRFPLPSLILVVLAGISFYGINIDTTPSPLLLRLLLTGTVVFFFSTALILFLETLRKKPLNLLFQIIPLLYGVCFFLTVKPLSDW